MQPPEPVFDFAPDYDFAQSKTISFYAISGGVTGNNPTGPTDFQRGRIDTALKSPLEAKGLTFVGKTADGDLLLSWHFNLIEKTDVKIYNSSSCVASVGHSRYKSNAPYNYFK